MNTGPLSLQYGFSTGLFVNRKEGEQTLLVGGVGEGDRRWAHAMTQRAAQILWFKLTRLLYPDKADVVTALAATAPLRTPSTPNLTTHVEVVRSDQAQYTLVGWVQRDTWKVLLNEVEARRLWAALDMALFPVGWEGRTTKVKKLN
jgi:hypothetical protein